MRLVPAQPPLVSLRWRREQLINVDDYRVRAARRLPRMVMAYLDGGADDEFTLRSNRRAFDRYELRTRVLTGNEATDLSTQIAGVELSMPVLLAPTGLSGIVHWSGERAAARAAESAGVRAIVSTSASYSPEEIRAVTSRGHMFQLYAWADPTTHEHDLVSSILERAEAAGFAALVVTADVPVRGNRESERRHGMGIPPVLTPGSLVDLARHPRWTYGALRHRRIGSALLRERAGGQAGLRAIDAQLRLMRPELNWSDFAWIRSQWDGPILLKGVLDVEDARRAIDEGVDGIVVSNHGGRQLDHTPSSISVLPAIVDAVAGRVQVLLDGGVRRGSDVVTALCLGADAVCIGRPYLYGLACAGERGVAHVLEILHDEIARTLTLMGVRSVADLDRSCLVHVTNGQGDLR